MVNYTSNQKLNTQIAIRGKSSMRLAEILPKLTRDRLYQIARIYDIPGRSRMNKAELVDMALGSIANPVYLEDILLIAKEEEIDFFENFLGGPDLVDITVEPEKYLYLAERGLIFSFIDDGKLYFTVPKEVADLYNEIDKQDFTKRHRRYNYVLEYILALINLYGTFESDELIEIFNMQNSNTLDMQEFNEIYSALTTRHQIFQKHGSIIMSDYFADTIPEGELDEHLAAIQGKPRYTPERERLLQYTDSSYYEWTPQLDALKSFILKHICSDTKTVDQLIDDIQLICSIEGDLQWIMAEFAKRKLYIKDEIEARALIPLILDVYNNTRQWSNRGYTPAEIATTYNSSSMQRAPEQRRVQKVGRNDSCPCGSGKKYKRCCG